MAGHKPIKLKRRPPAEKAPKSKSTKKYSTIEDAAAHCGVRAATFREYMKRYSDFPVHSKGGGGPGRGYEIDLDDLDRWREQYNRLNWTPPHFTGEPPLEDGVPIQRPVAIKDRKAAIQTDLLQIELDKERGLLIDRAEVVKAFSTIVARVAKQMDMMPGHIGRELNWPAEAVELLRTQIDKCRVAIAKNDQGFWDAVARESVNVTVQPG